MVCLALTRIERFIYERTEKNLELWCVFGIIGYHLKRLQKNYMLIAQGELWSLQLNIYMANGILCWVKLWTVRFKSAYQFWITKRLIRLGTGEIMYIDYSAEIMDDSAGNGMPLMTFFMGAQRAEFRSPWGYMYQPWKLIADVSLLRRQPALKKAQVRGS